MESVEFYANLMYKAKMLGGAQVLNDEQVGKLIELAKGMNLPGKHPAIDK